MSPSRAEGTLMNELFDSMLKPILNNPIVQLATSLCWLFAAILLIALVFWTWRDAARRGAMPWFWALVVLLFNVFGWTIYMVVRPPDFLEDVHERTVEIQAREAELARTHPVCPACFKPVEPDYLICPSCMKKLKKECSNCERPLRLEWSVCPYCRTQQ
jgi:hypothetical protein